MVRTDHRTLKLEGVKDPGSISEIIQTAAETLRSELEAARKAKDQKPEAKPGVIDKMNYLTGLWQQGLISEENLERERKYIEEKSATIGVLVAHTHIFYLMYRASADALDMS